MKTSLNSLCALGVAALLTGCAFTTQRAPNPALVQESHGSRKLFVFMDGTNNSWQTRTNVRRLFELVAAQEDPRRLCVWIEGVGTKSVIGKALGKGLDPRILAGYEFLARNYRPGDDIYIFGFSRGALEARALCGMLAHCGIYQPTAPATDIAGRQTEEIPLGKLWTLCRKLPEEPRISSGITKRLKENRATVARAFPGRKFLDGPVKFLGIWDTVPGLQFTQFNAEGEQTANGREVPTPRYKVKPYPNIERIAHALSMDELRSKFAPLRVGPPLIPNQPEVFEVWFPGVHSDIGGGYDDSNEMAGISLDWMLVLLGKDELIPGRYRVRSDPLGILHRSELSFWGSFGSKRDQRVLPDKATVHDSFLKRVQTTKPLPEALDPGMTLALYRPDIAVDARPAPERIFMKKPLLPDGNPNPDPASWTFSRDIFERRFKVVTTADAESGETTGRPLTPAAALVKIAPVAAAPEPEPVKPPPATPVPVAAVKRR